MRKVFIKDSIRNIRKKIVPFTSVAFVTSLAIMAFLGIEYGAAAIRNTSHGFYRDHNFRDAEVYSSKYLSQDDIDAISQLDEVRLAEGVMSVPAQIKTPEMQQDISVVSLTKNINTVELIEGVLPQETDECVIERELMEDFGLKIGDTVTVTDHSGKCPLQLKSTSFRISGSVYHPDHYFSKHIVDENRYILANEEAFNMDAVLGRYTKAVISADISAPAYSDEYYDEIEKLKKKLSLLQEKRRDVFYDERTDIQVSIALADAELQRRKAELDQGSGAISDARTELSKKESELNDAKKNLLDSEAELKKAEQELKENRKKLDSAKEELLAYRRQLDEGKIRLDIGAEELAEAERTLSENRLLIEKAKKELDTAEKELRQAYDSAEKFKNEIRQLILDNIGLSSSDILLSASGIEYDLLDASLSISDMYITPDQKINIDFRKDLDSQIADICHLLGNDGNEWDEAMLNDIRSAPKYYDICIIYDQIADLLVQWDDDHKKYVRGYYEYQDGISQYTSEEKKYKDAVRLYKEKNNEYQNSFAEYEKAASELENGEAEYTKGEEKFKKYRAEYENGLKEYNEAVQKLEDAKKEISSNEEKLLSGRSDYEKGKKEYDDSLSESQLLKGSYSWYILDTKGNAGFYAAEDTADGFFSMALTFGMIFLFVGALVLFSTISRMITDQQKQVGTIKALGFRNYEIIGKYMLFALASVSSGIIFGILAAYFIVQKVHIDMNLNIVVTGQINQAFVLSHTLISLITGLMLAAATVIASCLRLVKLPARSLLSGNASAGGFSKKRKKNTQHIPLYFRLILRNIRKDWQRVLVTVTSIAGCCVLMIVGLTFSFTLKNTLRVQYNDIISYDSEIYFDTEADASAETEISRILKKNNCDFITLQSSGCLLDINDKFEQCQVICGKPDDISDNLDLRSPEGNTVQIPDEGVLITHTLAKSAGLSAGDDIILYDMQMNPYSVRISGLFTYYIGQCIIVSENTYRDIFQTDPVHNQFWISSGSNEIPDEIGSIPGFFKKRSMDDVRRGQDDYIAASDKLAWLLIILAGVMAFLIILDLVNMYVMKKKRELVIMRINGFPLKNTIMYAALECILTTVAGIAAGIIAGYFLADVVVEARETSTFSFIHGLNVPACVISASITAIYSFFIHFAAFRKIRTYKITSLDSNE